MLLLTLLIALASPEDEGDPMRYVTHLVNPSTELQSAVDALVNAPPTDDLAVELASIRAVLEQVRKQREHIENAPAFRGDDALRTAMLADMTATLRLLETTLPEAARLARDPDPTNAELSAAGEAWLRMDAGLQRQRQARQDALAAFGEKHGLHLEMVVRERRSPYPAFEAEGLPPEGVQAPLQVYMALTAGYSNAHIVPVNRLHPAAVTAYRTLSTQDPDTIRQAVATVRRIVSEVQSAVEPLDDDWNGDARMSELAHLSLGSVTTAMDDLEAVAAQLHLPPAEQDAAAINERILSAHRTLESSSERWLKGVNAWSAAHRLDAFEAWGLAAREAALEARRSDQSP